MTARPGAEPSPGSRLLSTAALLLGKAQGSGHPAEQESLALGAYRELAAYLNSVELPGTGGGRRRERRLLADRRAGQKKGKPEPQVIDLRLDQARDAYRSAGAEGSPLGAQLDLGL